MTDITASIATAIQAKTGGNVEGNLPEWWTEFIGMVLAELQSAGRLVPAGGMALTAEQVEDVRAVVDSFAGMDPEFPSVQAAHRLRALFPATEPAEDGWGDVNPNDPQGRTYRETAEEYYATPVTERKCCGYCNSTDATLLRSCTNCGAIEDDPWGKTKPAEEPRCTICNLSESEGRHFDYDHPFTTELGPFDDEGNERTTPAPAEPAEEETKAETRPPLLTPNQIRDANPGKHQTYIYGQQSADGTACIGCNWETRKILPVSEAVMAHDSAKNWTHDHSVWIAKNGKCPCGQPASSPVVAAPTETEWPTVVEIPVGAAFRPAGYTGPSYIIKTALGYRITPNGDHRLWNGAPVGTLAPFVAAEERVQSLHTPVCGCEEFRVGGSCPHDKVCATCATFDPCDTRKALETP